MSTAPAPAPASSGIQPNICGLLCWVPLGPIPLIASIAFLVVDPYKQNKFIRFHAFQSLFFLGAAIAAYFALVILGTLLVFMGPLALLMIPIWVVVGIGLFGVTVFMCIKAFGNEKFKLPVIGDFAEKQANA